MFLIRGIYLGLQLSGGFLGSEDILPGCIFHVANKHVLTGVLTTLSVASSWCHNWIFSAGFPYTKWCSRESKVETMCLLYPSLRNHMPLFLQYLVGHTGQSCSVWERTTLRA